MAPTHILQNLVVRLSLNSTNYTRQMLNVIQWNDTWVGQMSTVGHSLTRAVTLPLTIMGATAVYEFAKFDKAMGESLSIMGKVGPELRKQMEDTAKSLSTEGVTSADKLAEAYYYLAQSGMNAEESLKALPVVNQFAIAGMFDMAKATDLLTDAQMALGLHVADSAEATVANMQWVGDVLVKASTLANASTEQFANALTTKSAAAMRFFNIEVEEGVAVLAAYSDMGKKGNEAGNLYDRSLRLLAKAALSNAEEHKKLGFAVYDNNGEMRSMADIVDNLDQIMSGLSSQQRAATLSMLGFEARSQQAITPLLGMGEAIRGYEQGLRNATGFTDEVAAKAQDTFAAQMTIIWNRIKVVAIAIGEELVPALKLIANIITGALETYNALPAWMKTTIVYTGLLVAAIGPMLIAISSATAAWLVVTIAMEVYIGVAAATAISTAAATTALAAFALVLTGVVAAAIYYSNQDIKDWIASVQEMEKLAAKWQTMTQKRLNKEVEAIDKLTDAKEKQMAIEKALALADKNYQSKIEQARQAKELADKTETWYGDKVGAMNRKVAIELEQEKEVYKAHWMRLREMYLQHKEKMKQPVNQDTLGRLAALGMPQELIDSLDPKAIEEWEKGKEKAIKDAAKAQKEADAEQERIAKRMEKQLDAQAKKALDMYESSLKRRAVELDQEAKKAEKEKERAARAEQADHKKLVNARNLFNLQNNATTWNEQKLRLYDRIGPKSGADHMQGLLNWEANRVRREELRNKWKNSRDTMRIGDKGTEEIGDWGRRKRLEDFEKDLLKKGQGLGNDQASTKQVDLLTTIANNSKQKVMVLTEDLA